MCPYSTSLPVSFNADDQRPLPELIARSNPDPADGWPEFPLQFHDVEGVRYYAVQDWILGVAQTEYARRFWTQIKGRLKKARIELYPPLIKLPYLATNNNHYQLDFATASIIWTITLSMSRSTGIVSHLLGYKRDTLEIKRNRYVYFIGLDGLPNYVKIGKTGEIQKRLGEIGTNIPFEVVLLHSFISNCADETERTLHKYFQSKHIRREWFQLDADEIKLLKQIQSDEDIAKFVGDHAERASKQLGIDIVTNRPLLKKGSL
jgi:hypothetical protein